MTNRPSPSSASNMGTNEVLHIVTVDSRNGRSVTDLDCYNEVMYDASMFNVHIHDDPRNICVSSPAARLCGLDLKLYFHHDRHHQEQQQQQQHQHQHQLHYDQQKRTNSIATLLTFNPEVGTCNHVVFSKAYVLLNNGQSPLDRSRLAHVVEFIDTVWNELYSHHHRQQQQQEQHHHLNCRHETNENVSKTTIDDSSHFTPHTLEQEDRLLCARQKFLQRCSEYRQYHEECSEKQQQRNSTWDQIEGSNMYVDKRESGVSDAATCHHDIGSKYDDDDNDEEEGEEVDGNDHCKALPPSSLLFKDHHQSSPVIAVSKASSLPSTTIMHCIGT